MVFVTVLVAVSTTDTVFEPALATYRVAPSELTSRAAGLVPTVMIPVTVLLAVSITDTALAPLSATYALLPLGLIATAPGAPPR